MKNLFKKVLTAAALCLTVLAVSGAVKAQAAELKYDAATDSITGNGYAYILKKADAVKIKASAEPIALSTEAQNLKGLGCKEGKAAYFYIADAALTEDKEVKANEIISILATKAKKVTGVINYTAVDDADSTDALSATVIDSNNKPVTGLNVYWSEDGESFKLNKDATALTGAYLKSNLEAGKTIHIKVVDPTNATRTSKAVKVKIAKQAKAPSVKIDVKKNTIALKNGFDFVLATKTDGNYAIAEDAQWNTVLPVLKTSTNTDAIVTGYTPLDKKDATATATASAISFTKTKVKALSLNDFVTELGNGASLANGFSFGVRKSATTKKPASAVAFYDVKAQTPAPQIYTEQNTSSYDIIAQGADVKFKTPTIVNAAWKVVDDAVSYTGVWTGIGENAKVSEEASIKKDEAAAKYEMAVIATADLANVDWSTVAWKAIKAGTTISDKTSTKYCVKGSTTKKSAAFTKVNAATTVNPDDGSNDAKVVLLIRRAGVKAKTISDSIIASDYMVTYLEKVTVGKNTVYQWKTNGAKVGADAYKWTINVLTWQKGTSDYAWTADATKTITGYEVVGAEATYALEAPNGFAYDTAISTEDDASIADKKITFNKEKSAENEDELEASIKLQENAKIKVEFAGLDAADKKEDAEVEMILGVAKDISSAITAPAGYEIATIKNGTADVTPASAVVNTAKDVIKVTFKKK